MKALDQKVVEKAITLYDKGVKREEIRDACGLNNSQLWLLIADYTLPQNQRVKEKDRTAVKVRQLRDEEENSWGTIAVRFGYLEFPESKIRRMYEEASGNKSVGLRIGRGGRFLNQDERLYQGNRRRPGITIPKEMTRTQLREMAANLDPSATEVSPNGAKPRKATAATKVAAAKKAGGAVKKAKAKPTKRAIKTAKRTGRAPKQNEVEDDPFKED